MSDDYSNVRAKKLKLKGEKRKRKQSKDLAVVAPKQRKRISKFEVDKTLHGGWWRVNNINDLVGNICIQVVNHSSLNLKYNVDDGSSCSEDEIDNPEREKKHYACYLSAADDGSIKIGTFRKAHEPPAQEEVFVCTKLSDSTIGIKTGYGKYIGVDKDTKRLIATSDAMGPFEQLEPVFQDSKTALFCPNKKFLSVDSEGVPHCTSDRAINEEMLIIRNNAETVKLNLLEVEEEKKGAVEAEAYYISKYQGVTNKKRKNTEKKAKILKAEREGNLHEVLLDRREKVKADRYCK